MTFSELAAVCRRRRMRLVLELIGPTGHPQRGDDVGPAYLRVRVLTYDGDVLAGRCQSDPGRESVDELAAGVHETLQRRGVPL